MRCTMLGMSQDQAKMPGRRDDDTAKVLVVHGTG